MVVEHTPHQIETLCDQIFIMYGKPGEFGLLSNHLKPGEALNTYFKGYFDKGKSPNDKFKKMLKFRSEPLNL